MRQFSFAAIILLVHTIQPAYSSTTYAGVDYALLVIDDVDGGKSTPSAWQAKIGHRFTRYFSVEGLTNLTTNRGDFEYNYDAVAPTNLAGKDAQLDTLYGIFLVLSQNMKGMGIGGFLKAGIAHLEITGTMQSQDPFGTAITQSPYQGTKTGFAWGVGINIGPSPDRAFMVEYNVYPETAEVSNNNLENSAFNLGVKLRF